MPQIDLLTVNSWPIWIACLLLAIGAHDYHKRNGRVPNALTFPGILLAFLAGLFLAAGWDFKTGGDLGSCAGCAFIGFCMMLAAYVFGGLGAGSVKLQTAFGAWIGIALPWEKAWGLTVVATVSGIIAILIGSLAVVIKAKAQKRTIPLIFPAQIAISIGSILAVAVCAVF